MMLAPLAAVSLAGAVLVVNPGEGEGSARQAPAREALSLAAAEATALKHQPTLEQALGQVEAAEGRVEQARAGYLPQVTVNGNYQRTTGNFAPRPGVTPTTLNMQAATGWSTQTYNYVTFGATPRSSSTTSGRPAAAGVRRLPAGTPPPGTGG